MAAICWLLVFIVLLIIEIATLGLVTIWFCGGAVIAFIAALLGASGEIQISLFLAVSIVMLIFTRPFAAKYINKGTVKTNVDSITGMQVKVIEKIDNRQGTGTVLCNGQEWTARAAEDRMVILSGTMATVVSVEGVKLIVKTIKEEEV